MDYLEKFKTHLIVERGLAMNTVGAYMRDIDAYVAYVTARGGEHTADMVQTWLKDLDNMGLAGSSRARKRMAVIQFLHFLAESKVLSSDPSWLIDTVKIEHGRLPALNREQVVKLMDACTGLSAERDRLIIWFLYRIGIRVSELCHLDTKDISFSAHTVHIDRAKGGVERLLPIPDDCLQAVQDYASRWRTRYALSTSALFVSRRTGRRVSRRGVSNAIWRASAKAGLIHATSHTMRRSCATTMLNHGADVGFVRQFLGHESITTTARYLAHSQQRLNDTVRKYHPAYQPGPPNA